MQNLKMRSFGQLWVKASLCALVAVGAGAGCQYQDPANAFEVTKKPIKKVDFKPDTDAGVEVPMIADPKIVEGALKGKSFQSRFDPFRLLAAENNYDKSQAAARFLQEGGNFAMIYEAPIIPPPPQPEPQPYRRLSGIVIGDTVLAIIVMEDGRTYVVRPGQQIPNSEWTVVSIDQDKAVLKRPGAKKPNTIIVSLESPPAGGGAGGNRGGGNNQGGGAGEGQEGRGGRGGGGRGGGGRGEPGDIGF